MSPAPALVSRACPVCGSRDDSRVRAAANFDPEALDGFAFASRKFPELMSFRLVLCPDCDLLYATPAPTADWLREGYVEADFDAGEESRFAARTYGREMRKFLPRLSRRRAALDIGTGDGAFLEELLAAGFTEVVGLEPSRAPVEQARPEIRALIRQGFFDPADFEPGSFDLITCFQTLEHVEDPAALVGAVSELLAPGGAFFTVGHNHRAFSARLLGRRSPIFDLEHLQIFSSPSLRRLLDRAGLAPVEVAPIANAYPLFYWTKLLPLPGKLKRKLVHVLRRGAPGRLPIRLRAGNLKGVGCKPS